MVLGIVNPDSETSKDRLKNVAWTMLVIFGMNMVSGLMLIGGGLPEAAELYRILLMSLFATGGIYAANEGIAWKYRRNGTKKEDGE